jgi:hypothetical protein
MKIFKNEELDSIANRSLTILESLANLGIYLEKIGVVYRIAIQAEISKLISEPEYTNAVYAMEVLEDIIPVRRRNPVFKSYAEGIKDRIEVQQKRQIKMPKRKREWLKIHLLTWPRAIGHLFRKSSK